MQSESIPAHRAAARRRGWRPRWVSMRYPTSLLWLAAFLLLLSPLRAQSLGEEVEVEYGGFWYPAEIVAVDDNQYLIHYVGWSDSWDEWVGPDRIRRLNDTGDGGIGAKDAVPGAAENPRTNAAVEAAGSRGEYQIGAAVEVLWDDTDWYLAEILDFDRGRYFIHYTGYDDAYDEWVDPDRIRPLPERNTVYRPPPEGEFTIGERVEVRTGGAGYGHTATIVEIGDGRYRLRYEGYDSTEWVSVRNIRNPDAGAVWDALMNRFYYDTSADGVLGYFAQEGEAPAEAYAPERAVFEGSVEIIKRESPYGTIDRYGRVSVAGVYLGRIRPQAGELVVWRNGVRVGAVSSAGVLREAGTVIGHIDRAGELYGPEGESIGGIDPRTGYILGYWGEAEPVASELHRRLTAAFLFFFTELQHAYRRFE